MSAPNAVFMKYIFESELKKTTFLFNRKDLFNDYFENKCVAAQVEIKNADAFLVASDFCKDSLLWAGVCPSKIYKCIYGVYGKNISVMNKKTNIIRCCFMGKVSFSKGAHALFNIINLVNRPDIEFHFYGSYDKEAEYYRKYSKRCIFHGHIPHTDMLRELETNDIVLFPSLADGFGFSVAEGLMRNNIAICSKNAGVSELIIDGVNAVFLFNR